MKSLFPFFVFALFSLQFGCASNDSNVSTGFEGQDEAASRIAVEGKMDLAEESAQESVAPTERKLIKTGNVSFETNSMADTRARVLASTEKNGGYIANESVNKQYDRLSQTLSVRVPAAKFDNFLNEISEGVEFFDHKNISVNDVTTQHIDLTARLTTKKELEARYLVLLAKADKVQDILEIERQSAMLREEIESVEGQLKYLNDQVGFSTLDIEFYVLTRDMPSFGGKFGQGLHEGWQNLLSFVVFIAQLWPFLLLAVLFIFGIRKFSKRKK